ncbi:TetR/AcrR family transcriptional regulator [Nonomuraea jiangxiensis]|uniref:DNA-binding transcriptional regulator, AcrR family n=1 Tax=Nonomuraea jiangxiensis TaxID=633440 RepID=A0A1G9MGR9_9ACTN|nr:TetR/AcrR family transcriptional regulator [Nonomuraea jiangxiensis]SDL73293.1 DNA-binding transcriptional regulator, AcrR family [Nonomuraea jiangxiensis]
MSQTARPASARQQELLERAYVYVLDQGLAGLSLRPLATAIGSSPRVLLFLFGSKEGLTKALLARARSDELEFLARTRALAQDVGERGDLTAAVRATWQWLSAEPTRPLLKLWFEAYAHSLIEPEGPWADFARQTVEDWLELLAEAQFPDLTTATATAERTLALAVLRGALLDLLATGDLARVSAAIEHYLRLVAPRQHQPSTPGPDS